MWDLTGSEEAPTSSTWSGNSKSEEEQAQAQCRPLTPYKIYISKCKRPSWIQIGADRGTGPPVLMHSAATATWMVISHHKSQLLARSTPACGMWLSLFLHWLHRHWCVLALFQVEEKGEAFDRPYGRTDGRTDERRPLPA